MEKIIKFENYNEKSNFKSELETGIKIESEHCDIYEQLEKYLSSVDIKMPWSKKKFYEKIAKAHLKELPDYYTRLSKMEKE